MIERKWTYPRGSVALLAAVTTLAPATERSTVTRWTTGSRFVYAIVFAIYRQLIIQEVPA